MSTRGSVQLKAQGTGMHAGFSERAESFTLPPNPELYVGAPPFRFRVMMMVVSSSLATVEWGKTVGYKRRLNNAILRKFTSFSCRYN